MHPLLHNRFVRFAGIGLLLVLALIVVFVVLASLNSARSTSTGLSADFAMNAPGMNRSQSVAEVESVAMDGSFLPPQPPSPGGYYGDLEAYEISSYRVTARTNEFDPFCDTLETIKQREDIDFQSITRSTNNCRASFFVEENQVEGVLATLGQFDGVEVNRDTRSVTRHREQLQSRAGILRQQLASVERSLAIAETEFDEIAAFARENNDASTLSDAIREKLSLIDTLTERKISLTSQLDSILQQSAELEAQLDVVQFHVSVARSYPIYPNQKSQAWEQAWRALDEQFTDTLIGITAFFGIFLLWTVRIGLYALVGIVVLRLLWKFVRFVWSKW